MPLLKDKGFAQYQFGGAVVALLSLGVFIVFILYLNIRFSVRFLSSLQVGFGAALAIQLMVAIGEQHFPRLKRFFIRTNMYELWKVARWIVWPLLALCVLFDVYSTAAGLRLEVAQRLQAEPSFYTSPLLNTIWTAVGGVIALAPEPLLVVTLLATVRLLRDRRRALAVK